MVLPATSLGQGACTVTFAVASFPSLQGPMQSVMQVGGDVAAFDIPSQEAPNRHNLR